MSIVSLDEGRVLDPDLAHEFALLEQEIRFHRSQSDYYFRLLGQEAIKHEQFKRDVKSTAMEYADRHGWCSVVRDALRDLGIDVSRTADITLEFRVTVCATTDSDTPDLEGFSYASIVAPDFDSVLDNDWTVNDVSLVEYSVVDVNEHLDD